MGGGRVKVDLVHMLASWARQTICGGGGCPLAFTSLTRVDLVGR